MFRLLTAAAPFLPILVISTLVHANSECTDNLSPKRAFYEVGMEQLAPFEVVKQWAQENHIRSEKQWLHELRTDGLPQGFSQWPWLDYKEWKGWNDFLGLEGWRPYYVGSVSQNRAETPQPSPVINNDAPLFYGMVKLATYQETKEWAIRAGVINEKGWLKLVSEGAIPNGISQWPWIDYRDEWPGWEIFLSRPLRHRRASKN